MKILSEQENVVLASTIFEVNKNAAKRNSHKSAIKRNSHKNATSSVQMSYHENYY